MLKELQELTKTGKIKAANDAKKEEQKKKKEDAEKKKQEKERLDTAVSMWIKDVRSHLKTQAANGKTEYRWYTSSLNYQYRDIKDKIIEKVKKEFAELNPVEDFHTENVIDNYDMGTYKDETFYFVKFTW